MKKNLYSLKTILLLSILFLNLISVGVKAADGTEVLEKRIHTLAKNKTLNLDIVKNELSEPIRQLLISRFPSDQQKASELCAIIQKNGDKEAAAYIKELENTTLALQRYFEQNKQRPNQPIGQGVSNPTNSPNSGQTDRNNETSTSITNTVLPGTGMPKTYPPPAHAPTTPPKPTHIPIVK